MLILATLVVLAPASIGLGLAARARIAAMREIQLQCRGYG